MKQKHVQSLVLTEQAKQFIYKHTQVMSVAHESFLKEYLECIVKSLGLQTEINSLFFNLKSAESMLTLWYNVAIISAQIQSVLGAALNIIFFKWAKLYVPDLVASLSLWYCVRQLQGNER